MPIEKFKSKLNSREIFHSEFDWRTYPSAAGYDKKFKWRWMATQLNTFFIATDLDQDEISISILEDHLTAAFNYAEKNYTGWARGFQSGLGVVCILYSENVTEEVKTYCKQLKSGKKWAGFSIPVVVDKNSNEVFYFSSIPMWGAIYFPYFRRMIQELTQ